MKTKPIILLVILPHVVGTVEIYETCITFKFNKMKAHY